jgi:hypothetical protein
VRLAELPELIPLGALSLNFLDRSDSLLILCSDSLKSN